MTQNNITQPLFGGLSADDTKGLLKYIRDNNLITEEDGVWVGRLHLPGETPIWMEDNRAISKAALEDRLYWKMFHAIVNNTDTHQLLETGSKIRVEEREYREIGEKDFPYLKREYLVRHPVADFKIVFDVRLYDLHKNGKDQRWSYYLYRSGSDVLLEEGFSEEPTAVRVGYSVNRKIKEICTDAEYCPLF